MPAESMADDRTHPALVAALYRFAWALVGAETASAALTQNVLAQDHHLNVLARDSRAGEVTLSSTASRLHTGGETKPVPPAHERVACMSTLSLQHAKALHADSLLKSFASWNCRNARRSSFSTPPNVRSTTSPLYSGAAAR